MSDQRKRWGLAGATALVALAFPFAWFAPLMRAGLLPLFGLSEISVVTGLQSLWQSDVILALIVTFAAIFAPMLKLIGIALLLAGWLNPRVQPALYLLGKLAMADIFLVALYIVVIKSIGIGRIETDWGLYLFTGCVVATLLIGLASERLHKPEHL